MTAQDIREIKTAVNELAVVVAKLHNAVGNEKEHNKETIRELREFMKDTKIDFNKNFSDLKDEICKKYDKHSEAITEHGKDIATVKESIRGMKSTYKTITTIISLLISGISAIISGVFR